MSSTITVKTYSNTHFHNFFGKPSLWMVFIFFLFVSFWGVKGQGVTISSTSTPGPTQDNPIPIEIHFEDGVDNLVSDDFSVVNGIIQNLVRKDPDFINFGSENINNFPVKANFFEILANINRLDEFLTEKIKNAVIAIDVDSNDEVYFLTYGNGVFRFQANGSHIQIIPPSQFSSPLDMVIDNNDNIIVADSENFKVRVYNQSTHLFDIGGAQGKDGNEFYGPTGLAVNSQNVLYVADAFTGSDPSGLDQVKLYQLNQSSANFIRRYGDNQINDPFRIAVDKDNNVYLSDSGGSGNTGRVMVFNNTDVFQRAILNSAQDSPGSLITDTYGYLYVVNYRGDLNFTDIYQDPVNLVSMYGIISTSNYDVDVFDPSNDFRKVAIIKENLNLPVDLALTKCGKLFVNDLNLGGTASLGGVNATFDFDIQKFRREDNFTANLIPSSSGVLEVKVEDQSLFKCDPQPVGEFSIIYKAENENQPPIAVPDFYSVLEDDVLEINVLDGVLKNDSDPDVDNFIAVLDITTNFGVLNLREDGSFTYTPGEDFNGTDSFTYRANDGQVSSAPVLVEITVKPVPDVDCLTSPPLQLDANGEAFLRKEDLYDVDQGNVAFELSKENFTCADLGENTVTLSYTYTIPGEGDFTDSCEIQIAVEDNILPTISCSDSLNETVPFGEIGKIVNYSATVFDDNCSATIVQTAGFASGSVFPIGTTTNTFVVTDDFDNIVTCSFTVTIVEEPKVEDAIFQNCPSDDITEFTSPDECGAIVTFSTPTASDANGSVSVIQKEGPESGAFFELGDTEVVFEATGSNGNTVECSFTVTVIDNEDPIITCPDSIVVDVDPGETTKIVTFQAPTGSDNCGVDNIVQTEGLSSGSQFPIGVTTITFMATDGSGNSSSCSFNVTLNPATTDGNSAPVANNDNHIVEEGQSLTVNAPGVLDNDNDVDGDALTAVLRTDVSSGILVLNPDGSFVFTPDSGFTGPVTFTYVANDGELDSNIATVTIQVEASGGNLPETQDDDFSIFIDETLDVPAPGILENDSFESVTSIRLLIDVQNGTLTLNSDGSFIYIPDPGFTGEDSFRYLILDGGMESNSATVTITVKPRPTQNEAPVANDDFYEIQQDGVLVVDPPGILGNDTDANGDVLTASVGSVTGSGSFEFNGDGSFKYTPLPGFTGTESFTYTANDGSLSSNIATVTITVNGTSTSDFSCKDELILQLDETGNAIIQASDLFTGDPGDREFTLSTFSFDCTNIGDNPVVLNYTGNDGSGSCTINVRIEDTLPPEIQTQNISISLDSFGFARITPEMVDNGTSDNCGVPELSLDILDFSCENLGINTVVFTAKDASGNLATQTVNVNVTGNCKQTPISAIEYIFIYPNPTPGPFTFQTPTGWIIEKADVFDYRGRYITTAEFPMGEPYNMDLSTLQTAVYTLHLTTNQGKKIIRVIIR